MTNAAAAPWPAMSIAEAHALLTAPGQPFEMEEMVIRGVNMRVWKNAPPTLRDVMLLGRAHGEKDFLVYEDERLTYGQSHEKVASIAAWIAAQGVKRGDRIAIGMRNYPEWMLIYWASLCLGVAVVGLNAWWVADELEFALEDSAPTILFVDSERLARLAERPEMAKGIKVVAVRTTNIPAGVTPWSEVEATAAVLPDASIDTDDDACFF
jgi:long-chain acyl-CoA synthetase